MDKKRNKIFTNIYTNYMKIFYKEQNIKNKMEFINNFQSNLKFTKQFVHKKKPS